MDETNKAYLGDAVYADFDGYFVTLTTEDGVGASNTIHLEPPVAVDLVRYIVHHADPRMRLQIRQSLDEAELQ